MLGLARKPQHKAGPAVHFVVYRSPRTCDAGPTGHTVTAPHHKQALAAFREAVATGVFSPSNGRRILVTGPDYAVQPEDHNDLQRRGGYEIYPSLEGLPDAVSDEVDRHVFEFTRLDWVGGEDRFAMLCAEAASRYEKTPEVDRG